MSDSLYGYTQIMKDENSLMTFPNYEMWLRSLNMYNYLFLLCSSFPFSSPLLLLHLFPLSLLLYLHASCDQIPQDCRAKGQGQVEKETEERAEIEEELH